jgi:hypothetical protein
MRRIFEHKEEEVIRTWKKYIMRRNIYSEGAFVVRRLVNSDFDKVCQEADMA